MTGKIRVGRSRYIYGKTIIPKFPEFTQILVLTKSSSKYGALGPYHLKNDSGQILENVYQFSKVYQSVPQVTIPYSTGNNLIVWQWPTEIHVDKENQLTDNYYNWRKTGKNNPEPVRNPVGWKHLKNCLFSLEKDEPISESNPKLNYIESRKKIYLPIYMHSVVKENLFRQLKKRLLNGENLLIIEVDGPHQESMDYYKKEYGVSDDFIVDHSVEATEYNLALLLNDARHPFGHGYCLAWSLLSL